MDNTFNNLSEEVLEHHGILGMKWGVRRYQPYPKGYKGNGKEIGEAKRSRREISKDLKKNENKYIKERFNYQRMSQREETLRKRTEKRLEKGKKPKESSVKKGLELSKKLEVSEKKQKEYESKAWKLMGEAAASGYNVTVDSKSKWVAGSDYISSYLIGGPIGGATFSSVKAAIRGDSPLQRIEYNKYHIDK